VLAQKHSSGHRRCRAPSASVGYIPFQYSTVNVIEAE
jgi:hypothetical protein